MLSELIAATRRRTVVFPEADIDVACEYPPSARAQAPAPPLVLSGHAASLTPY